PFPAAALGLCLLTAGPAAAQFATGFEPEEGYVVDLLDGQNGWYLPSVGGASPFVDTNDGGLFGLPVNPNGASQIEDGFTLGDGNLVRGQQNVAFASGSYTLSYDVCVSNVAWPDTTAHYRNNNSSVSTQDSTTANYTQTLNVYLKRPASGGGRNIKWSSLFLGFDATGTSSNFYRLLVFSNPNSAFDKLKLNNRYPIDVTFNFGTNALTAATSTDITGGGAPISVDLTQLSTPLYLAGGRGNVRNLPAPTAIRLFVGGGTGEIFG